MLFNSIDFAIFLPVVFVLYWLLASRVALQNTLIVISSYVFYGWWDWRFLLLIVFSTIVDYTVGAQLGKTQKVTHRKMLLWISIFINVGLLAFFKYYNFFVDNFVSAFSFFGTEIRPGSLNVILPIGISFYTFQTLSYTIDVYRRTIKPVHNLTIFAAYVSFFPQLVAGPIERAKHLLPQFQKDRTFEYEQAVDGMRQILWGLFKKVVVADNCAEYANLVFNNSDSYPGSALLLGALFFTFQIYGDFSGYSDIAIGTARLFGFDLMQNFAFPYFSRDIAEFWRRWHISLSTWFRDYLYIPLGGSRGSLFTKVRNTFIIFVVSGFWHGANWTFVCWGALNALYFMPLLLARRNRSNLETVAKGKLLPSLEEALMMLGTFSLTVIAWIFFRAETMGHAIRYLDGLFSASLFSIPHLITRADVLTTVILIIIFMVIEWLGREQPYALANLRFKLNSPLRWVGYTAIVMTIFLLGNYGKPTEFIYFQF